MRVTLLEAMPELGGKSRRFTLDGQRIDTGPEIITFLGIWEEYLRRWEELGDDGQRTQEIAGLDLRRLPELGTYHYRDESCSLPVEEGHPWHAAWERYVGINATFGPDVTLLLSSDWKDPRIRPVLGRVAGLARLTAEGYLDSLPWLPEGLKEIIAVHTLNAGTTPRRTPALFAAMPAVMATEGVGTRGRPVRAGGGPGEARRGKRGGDKDRRAGRACRARAGLRTRSGVRG